MKSSFKHLYLFLTLIFFALSCNAQKGGKGKKKPAKSSINPKAEKCFNEAKAEFSINNYKEALNKLQCAFKNQKNYGDAFTLEAMIYEAQGNIDAAIVSAKKAISTDSLFLGGHFYHAQLLFKANQYEQVLKVLNEMEGIKKRNPKIRFSDRMKDEVTKLRTSAEFAIVDSKVSESIQLVNMGPEVNSVHHEYWPYMMADGKKFIFTRLGNNRAKEINPNDFTAFHSDENFYECNLTQNNSWTIASLMPGKINTPENEGTATITLNGNVIFYTMCNQPTGIGSCDLYYSKIVNNSWTESKNLGPTVNSSSWDSQPTIGPDSRTLIFSAKRADGFGGSDLYMTKFEANKWSTPVNLGPEINTIGDESAPFLHYDGVTLYFSSNMHPGYGGQDIFLSRYNKKTGKWSKPKNMGKGLNTNNDDVGLYVDIRGNKAYFFSNREGGYGGNDIWSFTMPEDKKPQPVSYVIGGVFHDETRAEQIGNIQVIDLQNGDTMLVANSSFFTSQLVPNQNYGLFINAEGFLPYSQNFQPNTSNIDSPFRVYAYLKPLKKGQIIALSNIFFDTDKFDLKSESFFELDQFVSLLKQNPSINVEISGHTDNTGGKEYNLKLSQNRANSVVEYLVNKGIDKKRLTAKGYGDIRPAENGDNSTPEGRARNRRIEVEVK